MPASSRLPFSVLQLVERIADLERHMGETDRVFASGFGIFAETHDGEVVVVAEREEGHGVSARLPGDDG